jgi:hypothetical protein
MEVGYRLIGCYGYERMEKRLEIALQAWSDDYERLTYKQLELSIADFKKFVAT